MAEEVPREYKQKENVKEDVKDLHREVDTVKPRELDDKHQQQQWKQMKLEIATQLKRVNSQNIKETVINLFKLNLYRGKGLLVRQVMKNQMMKPKYTPTFASLMAIINSKLPEIGELLVKRLILQFRKNYLENNYDLTHSSSFFLCYLVNQRVVNELLVLQIVQMLLDNMTPESLSLVVDIVTVVGEHLSKEAPLASNMIFDKLRLLLHGSNINKFNQERIEELLRIRRSKFKGYPAIWKNLDLVEKQDQETHIIELDGLHSAENELNVYQFDAEYNDNELEYDEVRQEILGDEDQVVKMENKPVEEEAKVIDLTEAELMNYQKTVYLTVMSSMSADEAVHKLLRINLKEGTFTKERNNEIIGDMIIKCCSQEKTYSKYYGVIGEKLCQMNQSWHEIFIKLFHQYYESIDNYQTNELRNIGKFFGHLFASDVLSIDKSWSVIKLSEQTTTSSSRILLKFIFQEMVEELGIKEMEQRLILDEYIKPLINDVFPVVNCQWEDGDRIRFSINFFTAIGLGKLTEEMRQVLKDLPEPRGRRRGESSRSSSYSRSGSERSYSRSGSERSYSRSGSERSYSRSGSERSYSRSRSRSKSRSRSPGIKRKLSNDRSGIKKLHQ